MKSSYYVASVVRAYRLALNSYMENPEKYEFKQEWLDELSKASHREFGTGFYFGKPGPKGQIYKSSAYVRDYAFVGLVQDYDPDTGLAIVEQRNKMNVLDKVEVIGPYKETMFATIEEMYNEDGEPIESAPHARQIVKLKLDIKVDKNYMLRKPIVTINTI